LPNAWVDETVITDKAAKHDDAAVHTGMWDKRITLLYPEWSHQEGQLILTFFRDHLMRHYRHRLLSEFRSHMHSTHGGDWVSLLTQHRAELAMVAGTKRAAVETAMVGRKRQKGGLTEFRTPEASTHHRVLPERGNTSPEALLELFKDAQAGLDIIRKATEAEWWDWCGGSTLIFWRWPAGFQRKCARDGMPAWIQGPLPRYKRRARTPKLEDATLLAPKFLKILKRKYVVLPDILKLIKSLVDYFYVPKAGDIRPVYDGAKCGLNDALWSPNFWLPIARAALRLLGFGYYSVDIDLGEFFLNFPSPEILRQYSGIDLTPFFDILGKLGFRLVKDADGLFKVRWERCWMGCKPSPFFAIRFYYWAEEFARGNHTDPDNKLRWDIIILNLPGDAAYDPTQPRVMKWDEFLEKIAGDIIGFVDDLRASGHSMEAAWAVARQIASRLQYLGIQDAPRKRRPPSQSPGAWAGAVFSTKDGKVTKSVTQEKWDKAKSNVRELIDESHGNPDHEFVYKRLEQIRGFLCHMCMTYETLTPFLKGLHLTLASYLPHRDSEGWKMSDKKWLQHIRDQVKEGKLSEDEGQAAIDEERQAQAPETEWLVYVREKLDKQEISEDEAQTALEARIPQGDPPPRKIKGVLRLAQDLGALWELLSSSVPPEVNVRSSLIITILYGFADASGMGFGSTVLGTDGTRYRIGVWDKDTESESSNFREFENVVEALEDEARRGTLRGAVIYLCTDNSTVEAALYKGNSSSVKLFELVVRVRKLEMHQDARILVSHVSGERMKAEGTDGASRGQLKEGVTIGENMLDFIPWNLLAPQRLENLKPWLLSWIGDDAEFIDPAGWFTRGHDQLGGSYDHLGFWHHTIAPGKFIWTPPPAAADVALEELRKARLKRQDSTHFFVCPRLLTPEWLKQLWKAADMIVSIPVGTPGWPTDMFEPLTIGIIFPFLPCRPWQFKGTPKMFFLARQVHKMFKEKILDPGSFLRELLLECGRIFAMPADVVRRVLYFRPRCELLREPARERGNRKRKRSSGPSKAEESLGKQAPTGKCFPPCSRRRSRSDPV
jgi:hypothetical protein